MKNLFLAILALSAVAVFAAAPKSKEKPGYVYVLHNPAFADSVVKIGMTTRSPEKRLKELSGTSVPYPFKAIRVFKTKTPRALERELHAELDTYRIRKEREFFAVPDSILDSALKNIPAGNAQLIEIAEKPRRKVRISNW